MKLKSLETYFTVLTAASPWTSSVATTAPLTPVDLSDCSTHPTSHVETDDHANCTQVDLASGILTEKALLSKSAASTRVATVTASVVNCTHSEASSESDPTLRRFLLPVPNNNSAERYEFSSSSGSSSLSSFDSSSSSLSTSSSASTTSSELVDVAYFL